MFKIKFIVSYDGTAYSGWQRQNKAKTIQGSIEEVFSKIFSKEIQIIGAGRTDSGVHAKNQIASCSLPKEIAIDKLQRSVNALLPNDITITKIEAAEEDFHPRYSATGKIYTYNIYTKLILDPFKRHHHYHHPYPLNLSLIEKAIPHLIGTKDFSSFANHVGKNTYTPSPIKTIFSITIKENADGFSLTFHGDGFLYKMVRNITGALLDIGRKKISSEELCAILKRKSNTHKLYQAPALGLCLDKVEY